MGTIPATARAATGATVSDDDRRFYRLMLWGYATLFPLMALFVVTALLADSSAVVVYSVNFAITIVVQGFSIYAMRQVMRQDYFRFPYGAGKLENFAAFLGGVLNVPSGLYMAYGSVLLLINPQHVRYGLCMIPVAAEATRMFVLYTSVRRLARKQQTPAPLLQAYLLDWRVNLLSDCGVLVAFAVGWLLVRSGLATDGDRLDPAIALTICVYMVWIGVVLVRRNFHALMDLPLPEEDQLQVMKVLAAHYADFETVGRLYTRTSGKERIVEIELVFDGRRPLEDITALGGQMEESLAAELPHLEFRVIPVAA
jgi:cation diffusion facilitator family transporter